MAGRDAKTGDAKLSQRELKEGFKRLASNQATLDARAEEVRATAEAVKAREVEIQLAIEGERKRLSQVALDNRTEARIAALSAAVGCIGSTSNDTGQVQKVAESFFDWIYRGEVRDAKPSIEDYHPEEE